MPKVIKFEKDGFYFTVKDGVIKKMSKKNKIGVGLITCNSVHRIKQSLPLIPEVDELVIVNDGTPYNDFKYPDSATVIQHKYNTCVGVSKNDAIKHLLDKDCDHIFLVEDDVLIKDPNVFEQYIKTAEKSGIWHLNYALQGPANRKQQPTETMNLDNRSTLDQESEPNPRNIIDYSDDISVALYPNIVGSFSYYFSGVLNHVGLFDERYKNAWEHVEHTYRIIKAGLHPPFWWFADVANSYDLLGDIPNCIEDSTIAKTPTWKKNFAAGMDIYKQKHGWFPQQTPQVDGNETLRILNNLEKNYARKVL